MKIGILQTDRVRKEFASRYPEYPGMFEVVFNRVSNEVELITYDVQHGQFPSSLNEVDAFLMTGSAASVYDNEEWIHRLNEFVLHLDAARKKFIGICFGHQMVAHIMGGETALSPQGWNIGVQTFSFLEAGSAFFPGAKSFNILLSHRDQVMKPAEGSVTLASNAHCRFGMCRIGDHILTIQGHPEFPINYARDLYEIRQKLYAPGQYEAALESLELPISYVELGQWMLDFIKK